MSSSADLWVKIGKISKVMVAKVRKGQSGTEEYRDVLNDYIRTHEAIMRRNEIVDSGASVDDLLDSIPDTEPVVKEKSKPQSLRSLAKQFAKQGIVPNIKDLAPHDS